MRPIKNGAAALVMIALLAACSDDTEKAAPPEEPEYTILPQVRDNTSLEPGPWAVHAMGDPDAPLAVFEVPENFDGRSSWIWNDTGQLAHWAVTGVYQDPCSELDSAIPVGPSVGDLAAALAVQERTTTTEPVPVSIDGHEGLYLELTTQAADFEACPEGTFLIWDHDPGGGRYVDEPGVDRYWILDVEGKRVVVSAATPAGASKETIELLAGMAQSATFVDAG